MNILDSKIVGFEVCNSNGETLVDEDDLFMIFGCEEQAKCYFENIGDIVKKVRMKDVISTLVESNEGLTIHSDSYKKIIENVKNHEDIKNTIFSNMPDSIKDGAFIKMKFEQDVEKIKLEKI